MVDDRKEWLMDAVGRPSEVVVVIANKCFHRQTYDHCFLVLRMHRDCQNMALLIEFRYSGSFYS